MGNVRIVHPYRITTGLLGSRTGTRTTALYPVPGCVIDPDLIIFHFFTNCSQFLQQLLGTFLDLGHARRVICQLSTYPLRIPGAAGSILLGGTRTWPHDCKSDD